RDVEMMNAYREMKAEGGDEEHFLQVARYMGRDHARTPMHWNAQAQGGFSTGEPWIRVNPNFTEINAEQAEADPDSIFHYYRQLMALRKQELDLVYAPTEYQDFVAEKVYAYRRLGSEVEFQILLNFSAAEVAIPETYLLGERLIGNYRDEGGAKLKPWEARVYKIEK
ncbi:MAG: DUF3459 domain-containing protein, partial [Bacteroidota bacterium]